MRKLLIIGILFWLFILTGCSNNKQELEQLKQQNLLLQQQIDQKQSSDNLFNKRQECNKYEESLQQKWGGTDVSVSVFYSPYKNSCVYETISIRNGTITSKSITDILIDKTYIIDQADLWWLIYDRNDFWNNKTYDQVKSILKWE